MKFKANAIEAAAVILKNKITVEFPLLIIDDDLEKKEIIIIDIYEDEIFSKANTEIIDVIYDKNTNFLLFRIEIMLTKENGEFEYKTYQPVVDFDEIKQ